MWSSFRHDYSNSGRSSFLGPSIDNVLWTVSTFDQIRLPNITYLPGELLKRIVATPVIDDSGSIYFSAFDGYLRACYPNGSLKWIFDLEDTGVAAVALRNDSSIISTTYGGKIYAISSDGEMIWNTSVHSLFSNSLFSAGIQSSPVVGKDGTIYIGTVGLGFLALDPDGELKWLYYGGLRPFTLYPSISPTFISTNSTVTTETSFESDLDVLETSVFESEYNYSTYNITFNFTFNYSIPTLEPSISFQPTISIQPTFEPSISIQPTFEPSKRPTHFFDDDFYGVVQTGNGTSIPVIVNPQSDGEGNFFSTPAIDEYGNIFVVSETELISLSPEGNLTWSYNLVEIYNSPTIGTNGLIHVQDQDKLYAFNASNGAVIWRIRCGIKTIITYMRRINASPSIGPDGTIYTTSLDSNLYAVYPIGSIKWTIRVPSLYESSPVIDKNGNIYISFDNGYFNSYFPTGSLRWSVFTNNSSPGDFALFSSSPAIGNNVIYVGSGDGSLYAIGSPYKSQSDSSTTTLLGKVPEVLVGVFSGLAFLLTILTLTWYLRYYRMKYSNKKNGMEVEIDGKDEGLRESTADIYSNINVGLWMNSHDNDRSKSSNNSIDNESNKSNSPTSLNSSNINNTDSTNKWSLNRLFNWSNSNSRSFGTQSSHKIKVIKLNSDTLDSNNNNNNGKLLKSGTYHPSELLLTVRPEHRISWSDIKINETFANAAIIGHGSFGIVIKAHWNPHLINPDAEIKTDIPVAIKVMTKSLANGIQDVDLHSILKRACDEVTLVADAESKIGSSRNIIKMYGVAVGSLPNSLTELFRLQPNEEGVGIVMRYEEGGSLYSYLYENTQKNSFTMIEKLRVLCEIARGISDIHRVRVVHADLKPDNVLLSSKSPNAAIRLADFGLSTMKSIIADESFGDSTLALTARLKGTPIYCAPEMLINPFIDGANETQVAKPSRKTDMYAFALIAWEVLAETKPFLSIKSEAALCSKVHQGIRPDLNLLPPDTPMVIQGMITACWDKNRAVRKSAIECLAILECQYNMMRHAHVDIYLMSSPSYPYPGFLTQIYRILSEAGYVVQFDRQYKLEESEYGLQANTSSTSTVVIPLLDVSFQNNTTCQMELNDFVHNRKSKLLCIAVQNAQEYSSWMNEELKNVIASFKVIDFHDVVSEIWDDDDDDENMVSETIYNSLKSRMEVVIHSLKIFC